MQRVLRPAFSKFATQTTARRQTTMNGANTSISSNFDAGNIEVVDASDPYDIKLKIIPDPWCESDQRAHFQWYSFRAHNLTPGKTHVFRIVNARDASYAPAWEGYQSVASFDRTDFFRVPTTYTSGELVISHMIPEGHSACQYSYFAPYSYERHLDLIARCSASPLVQSYSLGQTLDKREIDCLEITDRSVAGDKKHALWIIARQHPGESMAEWLTEGLLERLLDPADPVASNLLKTAVIFVVPNVCPDGAIRGHLRTNAAGANLNREWAEPTLDRAPEVYWILQKMKETGVDFLLDVHGDEELPANFIAGLDGIPSFDDRLRGLQEMFTESLMRLSPDFQNKIGYGTDAPGRANLKLCSKAIGERFNTLSLTFEMPFKDAACNPEPIKGWSPERAKVLGKAIVGTLFEINPHLRARG